MSRPQNSVMSDFTMPSFELEEPQIDTTDQKLMAKFAGSKGWEQQKEFLQTRIEYWQHFLPDGRAISKLSPGERETAWQIADNVIREINLWIAAVQGVKSGYENTDTGE